MLRDLRVAATVDLREVDNPFGPCDRHLLEAREDALDARRRVGGRCRKRQRHGPARVEPALDEARLHEEADEHARIAPLADHRRQLVGLDGAGSGCPVHRSQLVERRHVLADEAAECRGVAWTGDEHRLARLAVAAGAADHLDV